jgi:hypothetical protein
MGHAHAQSPMPAALAKATGRTALALPRVRRFLDLLVEGQKLELAADEVGLRRRRARALIRDPAIRREYFREIEDVRTSQRARNIRAAIEMREKAMAADANAAQQKVGLEAIRYLDGEKEGGGGLTINGNVGVVGYVVDLTGPFEGPRLAGQGPGNAKPLIEHED